MNFRTDINGLRAYAVMLVILYHFGFTRVSGGFLGVDVFFVISGYLMTSIILSRLRNNRFSLLAFYAARCRRIIPPLMVLCVILMLMGYFLMPPDEYNKMAEHAVSSLSFISNVVYFKQGGYFDSGSIYKWLLHTWSLSVEWQFYLLLPLALMFTARFLHQQFAWAMGIAALLSFGLVLVMVATHFHLTATYYLLPTRAWEMLAGGLLYLTPKTALSGQRWIPPVAISGLIICALCFDESMAWPGIMTLIPVLLTALIIHAGVQNSRWLNNRIVQHIGKTSYSVYLWHWPLWVFWHLVNWPITLVSQALLILLSLAAGWASWLLVENKQGWLSGRTYVTLGQTALVLLVGVFIVANAGLPSRAPQVIASIKHYSQERFVSGEKCFVFSGTTSPQCVFGRARQVNLVVLGDSHAAAMLSSIVESARPNDAVVFIAQSGCPSMPDIHRSASPDCGGFVKNALIDIERKYPHASVLIINRLSFYLHGSFGSGSTTPDYSFLNEKSSITAYQQHFGAVVKQLASHRRVFIMTPVPEFGYDVIYRMSRDAMRGNALAIQQTRAEYQSHNQETLAMLNSIAAQSPNVALLDATQALCDSNFCYGAKDDVPLYRDDNHLSEVGNKSLSGVFAGMWRMIDSI
ncbi:acyltransferase family protein [Pantoea sp. GM01]|uniref:acyltransferase family protein n=1 Tax=Pantoea sp. GM01 TaxID=1144320 RepID=UPI0002710E94|nr:acyltransferase family protein [Pantoea sp. GM01]EJL92513.1 putative acyltransferase [Pantoea sp. GM01]